MQKNAYGFNNAQYLTSIWKKQMQKTYFGRIGQQSFGKDEKKFNPQMISAFILKIVEKNEAYSEYLILFLFDICFRRKDTSNK